MVEIIILAAVAGFLFLRLRDVLGRHTGHENTSDWFPSGAEASGGPDGSSEKVIPFPGPDAAELPPSHDDIAAVVDLEGPIGETLVAAKEHEPGFDAEHFVEGARAAYEMILMAFENGDKTALKPLLAADVYDSFTEVIDERTANALSVDARFIGLRSSTIKDARLEESTRHLQVDVRFDAEMIVAVRNADGDVVDGDPAVVRRMNDLWTFERQLGDPNPGWLLVETGD